jgi:Rap1a immunity proteins
LRFLSDWFKPIALLLALGAFGKADSAELFTRDSAASVVAGCRNIAQRDSTGDAFEQGQCIGLLKGLYYLSSGACIPAAVTVGVLARIVVRYIDDRPSRLDEDFRELALEALRHAWPCSGARSINFAETL